MLYWIIMIFLILLIAVVIAVTVSKLFKDRGSAYSNRYRQRRDVYDEDEYEDDEDAYDEEEDEYEYEPRRPAKRQMRQEEVHPAKRRWKIVLEDIDQQDQYSFIFYDSLGIGRASASSDYDKFLSLPEDLRVSKVHCAVIRNQDRLYLQDEGSKNHTFLNGKQVTRPIVIQKEDVITVGETRLEVLKIMRETR